MWVQAQASKDSSRRRSDFWQHFRGQPNRASKASSGVSKSAADAECSDTAGKVAAAQERSSIDSADVGLATAVGASTDVAAATADAGSALVHTLKDPLQHGTDLSTSQAAAMLDTRSDH